jgi:hypothetical protein
VDGDVADVEISTTAAFVILVRRVMLHHDTSIHDDLKLGTDDMLHHCSNEHGAGHFPLAGLGLRQEVANDRPQA